MKKIAELIKKIFETLGNCIIPTLPIMIGAGMLKVLLIIIGPTVLNILPETNNTYIVLSFVAEAGYYFMPIYIAISTAEVFKTNKFIGALTGGMLLSPKFIELVNNNISLDFIKLPIASTNYANQVLPSIIAVWIMSYIFNFLDTHINVNLKSLLTPLLTIIIMIPISFCLIGPLGVFLGNKLVELILLLKNIGPFGNAILCAIIPFITIFGLGGANLSAMLLLSSTGCDPILFFSNVIYNSVLGFVTFAIYLNNKKPELIAASITSCVAGTSEPALFGCVMNDKKGLISLVIGCFFGGLYSGLTAVKSYAMASFGIFGIVATISENSSIMNSILSLVIGCAIGFILSFILHKKNNE